MQVVDGGLHIAVASSLIAQNCIRVPVSTIGSFHDVLLCAYFFTVLKGIQCQIGEKRRAVLACC